MATTSFCLTNLDFSRALTSRSKACISSNCLSVMERLRAIFPACCEQRRSTSSMVAIFSSISFQRSPTRSRVYQPNQASGQHLLSTHTANAQGQSKVLAESTDRNISYNPFSTDLHLDRIGILGELLTPLQFVSSAVCIRVSFC